MAPSNCRIVLVRPRDPNNIGAVARAMKNFGFTDLAVVTPHPPIWDEIVSAINARDILTSSRVCDTLDEAIAEWRDTLQSSGAGYEVFTTDEPFGVPLRKAFAARQRLP